MKKTLFILALIFILFSVQACLEDFFSEEEEEDELNQGLVGVWYRYVIKEDGVSYGLPALAKMFEDGTGNTEAYNDADQDEPYFDTFNWLTNGSTITITDENDSTIWTGSFTLSDNDNVVTFVYSSEGHAYEEIYMKYSGEKDANMIGTWIMVDNQVGTEEPLSVERIIFNQDGSAVDYLIEDLEESGDVETTIMTWNSNSNYIAVFYGEETIPMVVSYSIGDDVFTGTNYDTDGRMLEYTFVKDVDEIDSDAVGTWTMNSLTIAGVVNPIAGLEVTLELNDDKTGIWTMYFPLAGTDSSQFNWKTNGGYVFIYDEETPLIAWVQEYTIDGNTLYLKTETDYYEGYGWVTSEYTFLRSL